MYFLLCALCSTPLFYMYNKYKKKPVDFICEKYAPRKYRKWKTYTKKNEWCRKYMKYLMNCQMKGKFAYGIPLYRYEGIDESKMTSLNAICLMHNINLNK